MSARDAMSFASELDDPTPDASAANAGDEPRGENWARRFGWVVMIVAPLVAYANTFHVPFVFDGFNYIVEKQWIADVWSFEPEKLRTFFAEAQTRPLVYLSFAVDYKTSMFVTTALPKLAPTPTGHYLPVWHVTNLAIHIIGGLALYGVARRGFRSPKLGGRFARSVERIALTVALFWVVHPLDTQSVTYLYQRHESLMGMFYFLTLFLFTRFAEGGRWSVAWAALSVGACVAGMSSKEVMITAPFVVLWYDRVFVAASWGELFVRRGLYHVVIFCTLGMLAYLMSFTMKDYAKAGILDTTRVTPQEYAVTQLGVVRRYAQISVAPVGLNIDYAWQPPVKWPMSEKFPYVDLESVKVLDRNAIVFPAIFVGGCLFLTALLIFAAPRFGFLAGTFFLILAPTSSIAPIVDLCFEHRMYVPLAPLLALEIVLADGALTWLLRRLGRDEEFREAVKTLLVVVAATVLGVMTLDRNHDYRSQVALWDDAQQKAPTNPRAKYNHGVYLQIEGSPESMDRAIEQYYETLKLDKNYSSAYLNLANIFLYRNQLDDAERNYIELLRIEPAHSQGRYGLADTMFRKFRYYDARVYLEQLLRDEPANGDAEKLLNRTLEAISNAEAAPTGTKPTDTKPTGPATTPHPSAT